MKQKNNKQQQQQADKNKASNKASPVEGSFQKTKIIKIACFIIIPLLIGYYFTQRSAYVGPGDEFYTPKRDPAYETNITYLVDQPQQLDKRFITNNHESVFINETIKNFKKEFLLFITPWNKHGYFYALKYAKKINYLSPVWYDIKFSNEKRSTYIDGIEHYDKFYRRNLEERNPKLKLIPRFFISFQDSYQILSFLQNFNSQTMLMEQIRSIIELRNLDGILLDFNFFSTIDRFKQSQFIFDFLNKLKTMLQANKKKFFCTLFANDKAQFSESTMKKFISIFDKILIQTYDYSQIKYLEDYFPISPIDYVQSNINDIKKYDSPKKFMFGIPFYGYFYNSTSRDRKPILGREFLQMLRNTSAIQNITYNEATKECDVQYLDDEQKQFINYPCLKFIQERLKLFEQNNFGAFVWEGGQPLEYLYNVF